MKHILSILLIAFISFNCQRNAPDPVPLLPTVTTAPATSITANAALSGGNATISSGPSISARGVCWGTAPNPLITGNYTVDGSGPGVFASPITGLTANTRYYVRAYATNIVGTTYGNEISFTTTNSTTALPTVTTTTITAIMMTTAAGGGNVTADGGAPITVRGICWSVAANPTIALPTKTNDGTGTGTFTSAITGLTAATTYHVRAYATNSVGTSYGGDSTFTTASSATIPTITTTAITAVTNTTANSGGIISTDGGAAVTARGVCWSTTPNPTIALPTKTTDGTGIGTFTSAITGLNATTTYHVRAYATNSVGTAYGADLIFTTTSSMPDVYVAGYENNGTKDVAKIWKNGVATSLTDGTNDAYAYSVFVSGTDVYVAGEERIPVGPFIDGVAKLWKNGVLIPLSNNNDAGAYSVFVSGTDVYVAGARNSATAQGIGMVWKNGISVDLTDGTKDCVVWSVFVSGTDVYASGHEEQVAQGTGDAKIWKNGIPTTLTNTALNYADGFSTFVSGTDVYVAGFEDNVAKLWKNGVATNLTNGINEAAGGQVKVAGSDVYVCGYESNGTKYVAKLWKNGLATSLTNGTNDAVATGVFILGADVYIAGEESNGVKDVAKIWKNGIVTNLTNGSNNAQALSIFVK